MDMHLRTVIPVLLLFFTLVVADVSCAHEKEFVVDGTSITAEPYGFSCTDKKLPNVEYRVNRGNVVLSALFIWTGAAPVYLAAHKIMEPYKLINDMQSKE